MTTSIRVPDTISKLSPNDTYPIVEGADVGGFTDLVKKVNDNTSKIETNITNIQSLTRQGKTMILNVVGDIPPAYDREPHGNYLIVARAMTKTLELPMPDPIGGMVDGAIITVYNDDTDNAVKVSPGNPLDSMSGGGTFVNIPPENFASFVYELKTRSFIELESGYIPAARMNMANYVVNSIKDKLHTFGELDAAGYLKGYQVSGDGPSIVPLAKWLLFKGATVTTGASGEAIVTITGGGGGGTPQPFNLVVDDGTTSKGGVQKINIKGMRVTESSTPNQVEITAGVSMHMQAPDDQFGLALANEIIVEPPLNTYADPNGTNSVILGIKHGYYERAKAPSYLAYFSEEVTILGKREPGDMTYDGKVWPNDIIVPSGAYIPINEGEKEIALQDIQADDPNIDGGTDWLVAYRISMKGLAPDDGFVRVYLLNPAEYGQQATYLLDKEGNPMVTERFYKKGQTLGFLEVVGIVNAKGARNFTMHVCDSFPSNLVTLADRTEGVSGIMLQALNRTSKTGPALVQFEADTNQSIEFTTHELGDSMADLQWIIKESAPATTGSAGAGQQFFDGWGLNNLTDLNMGALNGYMHFASVDSNRADFHFHRVFGSEDTKMLHRKDVKVSITAKTPDSGYKIALAKWDGEPDNWPNDIFTTRNGENPVFVPGWSIVDTLFLPEASDGSENTVTKNFTIPEDASNFAVVLYPVDATSPLTLDIKDMSVGAVEPFTGYILHMPELENQAHMILSDEYGEFAQDNQGYRALRYTINNTPGGVPMPCGKQRTGAADIEIDPTVNKVSGSTARGGEGALQFNGDGSADVETTLRICSEQPKGTNNVVYFWWSTVDDKGNLTPIPDSQVSFNVPGQTFGTIFTMPRFTLAFTKGARIALRAMADKPDGVFIQSTTPSQPTVDTKVHLNLLKAAGGKLFSDTIDMTQFTRSFMFGMTAVKDVSNVSSTTFKLDVPDNMNLAVLSAVKVMPDKSVRPVSRLDWIYSNTNKTLQVSFGETVATGRITLGIYS